MDGGKIFGIAFCLVLVSGCIADGKDDMVSDYEMRKINNKLDQQNQKPVIPFNVGGGGYSDD